MPVPLWSIALALAALAPFAVQALERHWLERRRKLTLDVLREAGLDAPRGDGDAERGP